MINEDEKKEIQEMIDKAVGRAVEFQTRKRGDTPTDDLQLTPRKYVNMYGSVAGRPSVLTITQIGQQYFATDASLVLVSSFVGLPIFRNSSGSWISAMGSVVAYN